MGSSPQNKPSSLLIPEIVDLVIEHVDQVPDFLNCACVNSLWSAIALKRLYRGYLTDMRYRTPDMGSLKCLYVASCERLERNMSFVKHLLLNPETPVFDDISGWGGRLACLENYRTVKRQKYAEALLSPQGSGPVSLAIPFDVIYRDGEIGHSFMVFFLLLLLSF